MKRSEFFLLMVIIGWLVIGLAMALVGQVNWQEMVADFFKKAHDFESTVRYLETQLPGIPVTQQPAAVLILCYSYKELGNSVGEEKWLIRYFKDYELAEPGLSFLDRNDQVKIWEYLGGWKRVFPGMKNVTMNQGSRKIPYFRPPTHISLDIETRAPCAVEVVTTDIKRETLYSGYLEGGTNTIGLRLVDRLKQNTGTPLEIILKSGSMILKYQLVLTASFQFPGLVTFDPQTGEIVIKGEMFQNESSEEVKVKTRKYFDKGTFFKKAVPFLAVGSGVLLLDRLVVHPGVNRETASSHTRAFMNGLDQTSLVMGAGISLKGLIYLFRSFKTKKETRTQTIYHPEAVRYNEELRRRILDAEKGIYVLFDLNKV